MNRNRAAWLIVLAGLLVVVLALALVIGLAVVGLGRAIAAPAGAPVHAGAPAPAGVVTESTLNVLYSNSPRQITADVRAAMRRSTVVRLQEVWSPAARVGVRRALATYPLWRRTVPLPPGAYADVILYSSRVWTRIGAPGWLRTHGGIPRLTPSRYLVWATLRHRRTGQVLTIANTHAVSGYCKRGASRPALRDRLAAVHWARVAAWTRRTQAAHPGRPILLGGDFNCPLTPGRPPAAALLRPGAALYRVDRIAGYDHLITSRTPGHLTGAPVTLARWQRAAASDHNLQLRRLRLLGPR